MIRFRVTDGASGVSFGGEHINAVDGIIEVPEQYAGAARGLGYVEVTGSVSTYPTLTDD